MSWWTKRAISNVKVTKVPQYKGITVRSILKFARDQINIDKYVPECDYPKEPNLEWLCKVANSLIQNEFQSFIQKNDWGQKKSINWISKSWHNCKTWVYVNFQKSQTVSTFPGKSHFLTRFPKLTKDNIKIRKLEMENEEVKKMKF